MKPEHDFLVFTSAGDNSNLHEWLDGTPKFDLFVSYYGEHKNRYQELTSYYMQSKGGKFSNFNHLYKQQPEFLKQYRAILVMDDDIIISCQQINRLFAIQQERDLWLLQPAFNPRGKVSHKITRHNPSCYLRYCNFVEMTCPLFRTDKLLGFMKIFDPVLSGWGADYWYMHYLGDSSRKRVAIVDEVPCINPLDEEKPGGLREIDRLQSTKQRRAIWRSLAEKMNIPTNGAKQKVYKKLRLPFLQRCRLILSGGNRRGCPEWVGASRR